MFDKIESEMNKIIKEDLEIERFELPRKEAIKFCKDAKVADTTKPDKRAVNILAGFNVL